MEVDGEQGTPLENEEHVGQNPEEASDVQASAAMQQAP